MVSHSRAGHFSPNPTIQTASPSTLPSHAGGSPSTSSPTTGPSSLTKIIVAQVYLLLSTIRDDRDEKCEQLRRLIDANGMEVFSRYFARLVAGNAPKIFNTNRPVANPGTEQLLIAEMRKIGKDLAQARKIAEAIETGNEEVFRDFDLSTFMEHFRLDALEKTILALAFKLGSRQDLKLKADAILSTNFQGFVNLLRLPGNEHPGLNIDFLTQIIDQFIQLHPPNFNAAAKSELRHNVELRYSGSDLAPPSEVLAALDLMRVLGDRPPNALALYIHRTGEDFTSSEATCESYLQNRPKSVQLSEEQVCNALTYTTISQTQYHNPSVLVAALRRIVSDSFSWQNVVSYFDQRDVRISADQFLRLYNALLPIAEEDSDDFDIQRLWGGEWEYPDTQLSFICAFTLLTPERLDATKIPGLRATFTEDEYLHSPPSEVRERALYAARHPLVSLDALSAVFNVALHSVHASQSTEAKRLFQQVVIPNLYIFVVSAFGVPKPWPPMAIDTLQSLFSEFVYKTDSESDFVFQYLWKKDKEWVEQRLIDHHAKSPLEGPQILQHIVKQGWLEEVIYIRNGFGLEMTALAHGSGLVNIQEWAQRNANELGEMFTGLLLRYVEHKTKYELTLQRGGDEHMQPQVTLQVRTIHAFLTILEELMPATPYPPLIALQRLCISAYPRLINYGEGVDDVLDASGRSVHGNALMPAAQARMEENFKKMYSGENQVRDVVAMLERYKTSRDPLDQDIFACMIQGLFEEYTHYVDYPLEALATTSVLFGGIISHKLVSDLPLKIGLGMILEAVRDHGPNESMYKFGLQALMQMFSRLREWPGFCKQLTLIPGLQGTEAWNKADEVWREHGEHGRSNGVGELRGGNTDFGSGYDDASLTNGKHAGDISDTHHPPPFRSINVDPLPLGQVFEEPDEEAQGKIQFVLNNLTETTLQSMFRDLHEMLEERHQQWFASHLVEERAKTQPNYHSVYLDLLQQFGDQGLWAETLRETYISISRMLNSEETMQNSAERTHLKYLGDWLGRLTLARDKPIKYRNIAFKELLIEAHDTDRLVLVIPFVCHVLAQGASSNVFRPPNPWLMDIIHLLIELYHNATLKLNLKFEIEVLCKNLHLDHKSIEPSGEILNRVPVEEELSLATHDGLDSFENMSLNGLGSAMPHAHSPHAAMPPIPDLGPNLTIPQTEVVTAARLHEIVRTALSRALQDIIQPVVDRSVTIAAIATAQMIRKDFATEPDENRLRTAAINMVKSTAGSLALVTSKEPLRAHFTNYLRNLSNELPQGLPEGVIIMCVNSNLDLASKVIENSAEERAIPEIELLIAEQLEDRRIHRIQHPGQDFYDRSQLSRWAMTIPDPYKLTPKADGLNAQQMAIYEDFARQPRSLLATTPTGTASGDAARSLAHEALQDYSSVPSIATPAETPTLPPLATQLPHVLQGQGALTNGRGAGLSQIDGRALAERVGKLLDELLIRAAGATEVHFKDLPRPHPVLEVCDGIVQLIIKTMNSSEEFVMYAAREIIRSLLSQRESDSLVLDTLIHVLETIRHIVGHPLGAKIGLLFRDISAPQILQPHLIAALLHTDLLDWRIIDEAMATMLQQRKPGSIAFLDQILDLALLDTKHPVAMFSDFTHSLEEAYDWIAEQPDVEGGQSLKAKLSAPSSELDPSLTPEQAQLVQLEQMDYVFDEWVAICNNPRVTSKSTVMFIEQLLAKRVITDKGSLFIFIRRALDKSIDHYDEVWTKNSPIALAVADSYVYVDALVRLVIVLLMRHESQGSDRASSPASFLDSIVALVIMVFIHHQETRAGRFCQKVFFRFFSVLLHEISNSAAQLSEADQGEIILNFAARLIDIGPNNSPGFLYQWIGLLQHRILMPGLLKMRDNAGWPAYLELLTLVLNYLGDQAKVIDASFVTKDIYRAVTKLFIVLTHDFPEFIVANHLELCKSTFHPCGQLLNLILFAVPESWPKMPDPIEPGLSLDAMPELRQIPPGSNDQAPYLREVGLLDLLNRCLERGPSEDAIAQITHAVNTPDGETTTFGFVPVKVNQKLAYAVTAYIGAFAVQPSHVQQQATAGSTSLHTLRMLVLESAPEARYTLLSSMVNQLRFPNAYTMYFSQALVAVFGHDMSDPQEEEIREQIVRILLERIASFWAHPWGLLHTITELVRSKEFVFFDLPFIKSAPIISDRFAAVLQRPQQ